MSVSARIINIERFSLNDGEGIRTVVYLKGCPLACKWCHNPEGIDFDSEIAYYRNRCVLCGTCQRVCPRNCYRITDGQLQISYADCLKCNMCVNHCPTNALSLFGKEMTTNEVMADIWKDKDYFAASNGGVTFSGGECLIQHPFMKEILSLCREHAVHTLIESSFCVPWGNIEDIVALTDMFYVDIKHMDSQIHKEYTGKGNELILQNIRRIAGDPNKVLIRIPLIPGVNDSIENLMQTYAFVKECGLSHIMLLRYNPLGESKYIALGKHFYQISQPAQTQEELRQLCAHLNGQAQEKNFFISE